MQAHQLQLVKKAASLPMGQSASWCREMEAMKTNARERNAARLEGRTCQGGRG
jgi:hypothetical protein